MRKSSKLTGKVKIGVIRQPPGLKLANSPLKMPLPVAAEVTRLKFPRKNKQ